MPAVEVAEAYRKTAAISQQIVSESHSPVSDEVLTLVCV